MALRGRGAPVPASPLMGVLRARYGPCTPIKKGGPPSPGLPRPDRLDFVAGVCYHDPARPVRHRRERCQTRARQKATWTRKRPGGFSFCRLTSPQLPSRPLAPLEPRGSARPAAGPFGACPCPGCCVRAPLRASVRDGWFRVAAAITAYKAAGVHLWSRGIQRCPNATKHLPFCCVRWIHETGPSGPRNKITVLLTFGRRHLWSHARLCTRWTVLLSGASLPPSLMVP